MYPVVFPIEIFSVIARVCLVRPSDGRQVAVSAVEHLFDDLSRKFVYVIYRSTVEGDGVLLYLFDLHARKLRPVRIHEKLTHSAAVFIEPAVDAVYHLRIRIVGLAEPSFDIGNAHVLFPELFGSRGSIGLFSFREPAEMRKFARDPVCIDDHLKIVCRRKKPKSAEPVVDRVISRVVRIVKRGGAVRKHRVVARKLG